MIDLVESIRRDHRRILRVVGEVADSHARWPLAEHRAKKAVRALVALESRHEMAEARFLWPVVRDLLRAHAGQRDVALGQEREARRRLHQLRKVAGTAAADLAPATCRAVLGHIDFEEDCILPALSAVLSTNDALRIGRSYRQAFAHSPTRPHPLMPGIPGVLSLVSPALAPADRVRDLLRMP